MQHLLAPQEAQAHQHLVCKLPDEPQTAAFEVVGLDVVIPAQTAGDNQPSQMDKNLMLCSSAITHSARDPCANAQHMLSQCTIQLSCGIEYLHASKGRASNDRESKKEDDAGQQVKSAGLNLQVDGKQLK